MVRTKRPLKRRINRLTKNQVTVRIKELQQSLHFARRSRGLLKLERWGRGLSDATRVHILSLLKAHGDLTATEIEAALEITQAAVSNQVRTLVETGLVGVRHRGWWTYYTINRKAAGLLPNVQPGTPLEGALTTLPASVMGRMDRLTGGKGYLRTMQLRGTLEAIRNEDKALLSQRQAQAIANRTRILMLALVNMHDKLTATELAVVFHVTHVAVSEHMGVLKGAGLVASSFEGKWIHYSTSPGIARMLPVLTMGKIGSLPPASEA
jgi:DNA-binding transcriptional ArsR family regulator